MKITWNEILLGEIPQESGIYAWYYIHEIGRKDISSIIEKVELTTPLIEKKKILKMFLEEKIFSHYEEQPYSALIEGKLKLKYEGLLFPQPKVTDGIIENLSDRPELLFDLSELLKNISPNFMRPLYIGMASDLHSRIVAHRDNINKYKAIADEYFDYNDSFAARVVNRKFRLKNLYITIQPASSEEKLHNMLEGILNRVNHPTLGRN